MNLHSKWCALVKANEAIFRGWKLELDFTGLITLKQILQKWWICWSYIGNDGVRFMFQISKSETIFISIVLTFTFPNVSSYLMMWKRGFTPGSKQPVTSKKMSHENCFPTDFYEVWFSGICMTWLKKSGKSWLNLSKIKFEEKEISVLLFQLRNASNWAYIYIPKWQYWR